MSFTFLDLARFINIFKLYATVLLPHNIEHIMRNYIKKLSGRGYVVPLCYASPTENKLHINSKSLYSFACLQRATQITKIKIQPQPKDGKMFIL